MHFSLLCLALLLLCVALLFRLKTSLLADESFSKAASAFVWDSIYAQGDTLGVTFEDTSSEFCAFKCLAEKQCAYFMAGVGARLDFCFLGLSEFDASTAMVVPGNTTQGMDTPLTCHLQASPCYCTGKWVCSSTALQRKISLKSSSNCWLKS